MDSKKTHAAASLTDMLHAKAGRARLPLSGTFELSPVCNFSCRMCYVRKTPAEVRAHERPMVTLDQWLDIAGQARDMGMLYLLLTGGEPFLWPDFWPLYEQLSRMGLLISINSNGSLIDADAIARLKAQPPTRINITLYGASDATYESLCHAKGVFSRVDRAICGLCEAGIQVKLNCSLTPWNVGDLEAIVAYSKAHDLVLSVNEYMFPPLRRDRSMVGKNDRFTPAETARCYIARSRLQLKPEDYRAFLERAAAGRMDPPGLDESCIDPVDGRIRCRAGKSCFWITWDGYMTPCGMMPEPKADLLDLGFAKAWQAVCESSAAMALSGVCAQCPDRNMCHACAAMALAETGDPGGIPQYLCHMVREMKALAQQELNVSP